MCPPEQAKGPKRPGKGRATLEMWRFREWFAEELETRKVSRRAVARKIGYKHNASRISEILSGKRVPGAAMVRQLAEAIDASPIEALWLAGYHEAFFDELSDLHKLGWMWCREDRASLDQDSGVFFFPGSVGLDGDPTSIPLDLAHRYHRATIYHADEQRSIAAEVAVPWPLALAIFIAIGAFPRRGDVPKSTHVERIAKLAALAGPFVRAAKDLRMPENFKEFGMVRSAKEISHRRYLGLSGTAIVSEYMNYWADLLCLKYAIYVRLALFEPIGELALLERQRYWLQDSEHFSADFLREHELKALASAIA